MKMTGMVRLLMLLALLIMLGSTFLPANAQQSQPLVVVLKAGGEVSPAMRDYINRGLKIAAEQKAGLVLIELNTPGGLLISMTEIVTSIRASRVPVAVFVTPRGGMAASAGTLITLAGHTAAMSPETIIGAASPVGAQGQDLDQTLKTKEIESLAAMARSIAARRGPEAIKLAEETIRNARAVSAEEARAAGLVDFIAVDLKDLLVKLDGFEVQMETGSQVLHTANATTTEIDMDLGEQILDALVKTDTVFLLMAIGLMAILIELSTPGGWVAGFIGVVSLAMAVYGLGILTVNWFGAIFLVLAFVLFVLDIKMPTHGALTAAGTGSFILGALVLFNSPGVPEFQRVSVPLVVFVALFMGGTFAVIVGFALRAQKIPLSMGQQTLIGATGIAKENIDPRGQVQLRSELWSAELAEEASAIRSGESVEVVGLEGLRLKVRKQLKGKK